MALFSCLYIPHRSVTRSGAWEYALCGYLEAFRIPVLATTIFQWARSRPYLERKWQFFLKISTPPPTFFSVSVRRSNISRARYPEKVRLVLKKI
jgi:hypothetical protein